LFLAPSRRRSSETRASRRSRVSMGFLNSFIISVTVFLVAIYNGRALSINRLVDLDPLADMRYKILPVVYNMINLYWPCGSGVGTFEVVYQISEPDELLFPSYINHVHNDWLETVVTAGLPGIALLTWAGVSWIVACVICAKVSVRNSRPDRDLAIAGLIGCFLLAGASLTDYPLRTPAMAALSMIMIVWIRVGLSTVGGYPPNESS
jgi:hypothetical protein